MLRTVSNCFIYIDYVKNTSIRRNDLLCRPVVNSNFFWDALRCWALPHQLLYFPVSSRIVNILRLDKTDILQHYQFVVMVWNQHWPSILVFWRIAVVLKPFLQSENFCNSYLSCKFYTFEQADSQMLSPKVPEKPKFQKQKIPLKNLLPILGRRNASFCLCIPHPGTLEQLPVKEHIKDLISEIFPGKPKGRSLS